MNWVIGLENISQQDVDLVGGKGAHLGVLINHGLPVPDGFCLTTRAYETCVLGNPILRKQIKEEILKIDFERLESIKSCSHHIREMILDIELPPAIQSEVLDAYALLLEQTGNPKTLVRSSSTTEDVKETSSAGLQDSFLGVVGADDLIEKIKLCWASLWNVRSIAYRKDQGLSSQDPTIAVVVQSMIETEVAGVMFTQHPITGDPNTVINASWGSGVAVVSGKVYPDEYVIEFGTQGPVEKSILLGSKGITLQPEAALLKPGDDQRLARCLPQAVAFELARLGQKIEAIFSHPQDIEWGFADNQIHIFQARPITSFLTGITPIFNEFVTDDASLWTSRFFVERFPSPPSPLGWTLLKPLIEEIALKQPLRWIGFRHFEDFQIFRLYQGFPFVNVQVYQMLYKYFPDSFLPADAPLYFPENDITLRRAVEYPTPGRFLVSAALTLLSTTDWMLWHYRKWNRFTGKVDAEVATYRHTVDTSGKSMVALLAIIDQLTQLSGELLKIHRWSLTYADALLAILRRLLRRWLKGASADVISTHLVGGLTNQTTLLDAELWSLSRMALEIQNWKQCIPGTEAVTSPGNQIASESDPKSLEFKQRYDAFIKKFGHRSFSLDIRYPPFEDDPQQVVKIIQDLSENNAESPEMKIEAQKNKREAETRKVKAALTHGWLGKLIPVRWLVINLLLRYTHIYLRLREDQRFYWQKILHEQRRAFMKIGEMVFPASAKDIFLLTHAEIRALAENRSPETDLQRLVIERKHQFARIQHITCPPFLKGNHAYIMENEPEFLDGHAALRGIPVSPGKSTGLARIIQGPESLDQGSLRIEQGDILVTRSTDPAWTPIMLKLGALVMETGGLLSHGSIIAREYGIPAVVGIAGATEAIREGELLEVDGSQGVVIRLSR